MALRGGGHLELKKVTRWIFGESLAFVWGDVQILFLKKKISFLQFYSSYLCFFTNALALWHADPAAVTVLGILSYTLPYLSQP